MFFICLFILYFAIYTYFPVLMQFLSLPLALGFLNLDFFWLVGAFIGLGCVWKFPRRFFTLWSFVLIFISLVILSQATSPKIMLIAFVLFTLGMSEASNVTGVYLPNAFPHICVLQKLGLRRRWVVWGSAGDSLAPHHCRRLWSRSRAVGIEWGISVWTGGIVVVGTGNEQ